MRPGVLAALLALVTASVWAVVARAQDDRGGDELDEEDPDADEINEALDEAPDPAICWSGVERLATSTDVADFYVAVSAALAAGDERLIEFLRDRLIEILDADPSRAAEVLDLIASVDDLDVIKVYAEALSLSQASREPPVRSRLLEMAENHDELDQQAAGLAMLETQPGLAPAELDRVVAAGIRTPSVQGADLAIKTIGEIMRGGADAEATDPGCGSDCDRYHRALLALGNAAEDGPTLGFALEMLSDSPSRLSARTFEELAAILRSAEPGWTFAMASLSLSRVGEPDATLALFREVFPARSVFCDRVTLFRDAAVAGGPSSLPLLAEFAALEPRLADDHERLAGIYATGVVDFDHVLYQVFGEMHMDECMYGPGEHGPGAGIEGEGEGEGGGHGGGA